MLSSPFAAVPPLMHSSRSSSTQKQRGNVLKAYTDAEHSSLAVLADKERDANREKRKKSATKINHKRPTKQQWKPPTIGVRVEGTARIQRRAKVHEREGYDG